VSPARDSLRLLARSLSDSALIREIRARPLEIRDALTEVEQRYAGWLAEDARVAELEPIEIRRLVGVQYAATVAAAAHLAGRMEM